MADLKRYDAKATKISETYNNLGLMLESCGWKLISNIPEDTDDTALILFDVLCHKGHSNRFTQKRLRSGVYCESCINTSRVINAMDKFETALVDREYKIISPFSGIQRKSYLLCPNDHICFVNLNQFMQGSKCSQCPTEYQIRAMNEFLELLKLCGYTLISKYLSCTEQASILCPRNHPWDVLPYNFKNGNRCPKCQNCCPEQAKEELLELAKAEGFRIVGVYVNVRTHIAMICPKDHFCEIRPNHFKGGTRCRKCAKQCPDLAREEFIQLATERGYTIISDYIDSEAHVYLICPDGHHLKVSPSHFKRGYNCTHCPKLLSMGERKVIECLLNLNIHFYQQFILRDILPNRRYDFYFELNGTSYLIEFDGKQHFRFTRLYHIDEEDFQERQHRDRVKTFLPVEYGMRVIRIDYTQMNNIPHHVDKALDSSQSIYFSTPDMYTYISNTEDPHQYLIDNGYKVVPKIAPKLIIVTEP